MRDCPTRFRRRQLRVGVSCGAGRLACASAFLCAAFNADAANATELEVRLVHVPAGMADGIFALINSSFRFSAFHANPTHPAEPIDCRVLSAAESTNHEPHNSFQKRLLDFKTAALLSSDVGISTGAVRTKVNSLNSSATIICELLFLRIFLLFVFLRNDLFSTGTRDNRV